MYGLPRMRKLLSYDREMVVHVMQNKYEIFRNDFFKIGF